MAEVLSIIVPVFNRENTVVRCLDSIKAQTYRPIHIIVVDNNSSDGSFRTVTDWGKANTSSSLTMDILSETRQGASAARNKGLRSAESRFVMFMDSDDAMRPELAMNAMQAFADNPDAKIVAWKSKVHLQNGNSFDAKFAAKNLMRNQIIHAVLATTHFAVDRRFIYDAGAWNENLPAWNDLELGIRLLAKMPHVVTIPKILVDRYSHPDSITGVGFAHSAGKWEKALDHAQNALDKEDITEKDFFIRLIDYRRVNLAGAYVREGKNDLAKSLLKTTLRGFKGSHFHKFILKMAYRQSALGIRGAYFLPILLFRR